jgi:hypothetical protein
VNGSELAFLAILLGAYFVGTVLGFGTTVLAVTFGAHLLEMDVVLPVVAPLNVGLALYIAIRHRRATSWRLLLRRVLPLSLLGIPIGLALFNMRQLAALRLAFGAFVVLLAAVQLRDELGPKRTTATLELSGSAKGVLLIVSGIVHGLWATPGPLLVYVVGTELDDKAAIRSTLASLFVVLTSALLVDYLLVGLVTPRVIELTLWALIPMLGGIVLGEWAFRHVGERTFRLGVWALLLVGGAILSARAALGA